MTSKLVQMQARFQQKQMQEKEEKLLKLYENQQQRAFDKVGRGSAGSTTSLTSGGGGKVRQMFDERRQKAGIDKSYPLEPLKSKNNSRGASIDRKSGVTSKTTVKSTVQNSFTAVKNGKPLIKKKEVVERLYENDNGRKSFEENRYDSDSNDIYQSKSHREILAMTNNHTHNDNLDNEVMPQIGFDDVDNTFRAGKLYTNGNSISNNNNVNRKADTRNNSVVTSKSMTNGVAKSSKDENASNKRSNLTNAKKIVSQSKNLTPKNSTPASPTKTSNSALGSMGDSKAVTDRTPSANRPALKQQNPRAVVARDDLNECGYCGRRFAMDRIEKHENICSKTGRKKRKTYDATKHRVLGTELESYILPRAPKKGSVHSTRASKGVTPSKKDWRRTHEEFISTIRAAKQAQAYVAKGGKLTDLPPPPPSLNPDYVQCPHCNRRFNESSAERHIPKCAEYQFNKPKPGSRAKVAGKK